MDLRISSSPTLRGVIVPPGDKSISHRAVILNSFAHGEARISNFSPGEDCHSTVTCLQALGAQIEELGDKRHTKGNFLVRGVGPDGLKEPLDVLNAGNSGTTMRLMAGLLAAQPFFSVITGDSSLRSRPMDRIIKPLSLMGAEIHGRSNNSLAPLAVRGGNLKGIHYKMPVASAQLKSSILIAAIFAQGSTTIEEPASSRDHTERMMMAMGVLVAREGLVITLQPGSRLRTVDVEVPADISSAAFWLVAGAIHPDARLTVTNVGMNPSRTGVLEVLQEMGAKLSIEEKGEKGGEPVADITVSSSELRGVKIGGDLIPRVIDEIPVLAVAAAVARGTTTVRDAAELRVKESDRIKTTAVELTRLGAQVEELPDGMLIHGGRRLKGTVCQSYGDHRLAMSLAVAGLVASGETVISDAQAVDISYPGFWREIERISGDGISGLCT